MFLVTYIYVYAAAACYCAKVFLYGVGLAEAETVTEEHHRVGCKRIVLVVRVYQLCQVITVNVELRLYHIQMLAAKISRVAAQPHRLYRWCQPVTVTHGVCGKHRVLTKGIQQVFAKSVCRDKPLHTVEGVVVRLCKGEMLEAIIYIGVGLRLYLGGGAAYALLAELVDGAKSKFISFRIWLYWFIQLHQNIFDMSMFI